MWTEGNEPKDEGYYLVLLHDNAGNPYYEKMYWREEYPNWYWANHAIDQKYIPRIKYYLKWSDLFLHMPIPEEAT